MAYPTTIANLVDVDPTDTLLAAGHDDRHNEVNTALQEIRTLLGDAPTGDSATLQARLGNLQVSGSNLTNKTTNEGSQLLPAEQFFYLGANGSGITNTPTNPYGVSPNLTAYGVYDFEYWLILANGSTGAVTAGWGATTFTKFNAFINVLPLTNGTAYVGINPFIGSTTNKAITGAATAATYILHARGTITAQNATARLPFQVSVASNTITPQAGSWFRFVNRGVSASGTGNITIGNVA